MPPERHSRVTSRQRPISCYFCRSRKLRCSRETPCTNCETRGLVCQIHSAPSHGRGESETTDSRRSDSESSENADLRRRLERLEAIISGSQSQTAAIQQSNVETRTQEDPPVDQPIVSATDHRLATDAAWLEKAFTDPNPLNSILSEEIIFQTWPIEQITQPISYTHLSHAGPGNQMPVKCIWLPRFEESKILLRKYMDDITYIHYITLSPSLNELATEIYSDLNRQAEVHTGKVLLLLSIVASATYSWTICDCQRGLFSTPSEANKQALSWIKATLDLLDSICRNTSGSLECIQGLIIVGFLIFNIEGTSLRAQHLLSTAISMARQLSIHQLDSPAAPPYKVVTELQKEVSRRVWWWLVASDWMLLGFAGPQEGNYALSPSHMVVRKPRNANDEDLILQISHAEQPLNQPTSMSYSLQRIRLAEIFRGFNDKVHSSIDASDTTRYRNILDVDAELDRFATEIPEFLQLQDSGNMHDTRFNNDRTSTLMITQRYMLHSVFNGQRCKLHLPYLVRGFTDRTYAYSREICLKVARLIIHVERQVGKEDISFVLTRLRFAGTLYSVYMACIVLVMNVCCNKGTELERLCHQEIVDACGILDSAQAESMIASKLLSSLVQVLCKHQIVIPGLKMSTQTMQHQNENDSSRDVPVYVVSRSVEYENGVSTMGALPPNQVPPNDIEIGLDLDSIDWTLLFQDLSQPFLQVQK